MYLIGLFNLNYTFLPEHSKRHQSPLCLLDTSFLTKETYQPEKVLTTLEKGPLETSSWVLMSSAITLVGDEQTSWCSPRGAHLVGGEQTW